MSRLIDVPKKPELVLAGWPELTRPEIVKSGTDPLETIRGAPMAIMSDGKLVPCDMSASDGSEVPYVVLSEAVDASTEDVTHHAWHCVRLNFKEMVVKGGWTEDALFEAFVRNNSNIVISHKGDKE